MTLDTTTPIPADTQTVILENIRSLVPDSARNKNDRRHTLLLGAVLALQSIDHNLVPPHWLMNVMAGRTDRLFSK